MTSALVLGVTGYLAFVLFVVGVFWVLLRRAPAVGFVDPAIREDREVEALEAVWSMPSFDPREHA